MILNNAYEKVSVIITVYNKEDYIVRCLQSVLNQSYPNIEVVVVDDCSIDDSKDLILANIRENSEIKTVFLDENKGLACARNEGLKISTGNYIFFLDADDYLLSEAISLMMSIRRINNSPMIALRVQGSHLMKPIETINMRTVRWRKNRKTKVYSRKSVASILFDKDYIDSLNLVFNEEYHYFADYEFLLRITNLVDSVIYVNMPLYVRGECIDPIQKPNMANESIRNYIEEYYKFISDQQSNNIEGLEIENEYRIDNLKYIEKEYLRFYFKALSKLFLEEEESYSQYFDDTRTILATIDSNIVNNSGKLGFRQLKAHVNNERESTLKWIKRRQSIVGWKGALKNKSSFYKEISNTLFNKLPIKKKQIVFESFGGKSYSCNPRAIYEELQRTDSSYKCIWAFNDPNSKQIPGNAKKVKRLSLRYYYYMATSKYWVINARVPKNILKREETIYIQTWHGTPLKRLASDMKEVHMPGTSTSTYKKNFYNEAQRWDYLVSPNDYSTEIFKRAFHFNKHILDIGYPRNDIFYNVEVNNPVSISNLKKRIGLPSNKKVVLYAPTWRDDEFYGKGEYKFDVKLDLFEMKRRLGDEYIVLLRMHYLISDNLNVEGLEGFAFNLSDYEDIADLYLASDILITDYSSVFFDYANLNRPILFYTYDLDKYRNDLRGFYINFEKEAPGPILMTSDEVINAIESIDLVYKQYQELVYSFNKKFCHLDDGNASLKIIKEVIKDKESSN